MSKYNINDIVKRFRNRSADFDLEPYRAIAAMVDSYDFSLMSNEQLKQLSLEYKMKANEDTPINELLLPAFALVREVSFRLLKMRPFITQVMAGIVMHFGRLAEMQTGEGKTLAAVMPAYLNALTGKGIHILTFNDYLAERDAGWMGPVYEFLGLTVGHIREGMSIEERRYSYSCDITYLTAKEVGFDYLKSFLAQTPSELVQRPFNMAVIDEADSILIDEARVPLVIAGMTDKKGHDPSIVANIIKKLKVGEHYELDEYERNVCLTDKGLDVVEKALGCGNLYEEEDLSHLVGVNNALHAEFLLKKDVDYIVCNEKIELVDEFTGRIADRRQWPYGLQEAIEAKEGFVPENNGQIIASVTLQNLIRQYPHICGMTGTAMTSADEFNEFYGLRVVPVPTNKPCIRVDHPDLIFTHKEAKFNALVEEVAVVHKTGRPILIGTCSVEESELLAGKIKEAGVDCQVLNAKNDRLEAAIIAKAGKFGAVTVSTNMAGRGTDIALGGGDEVQKQAILKLGGLYVIGTNKHESQRIDNQLRGRAGRQGDQGSSRFFVCLEDDLMIKYNLQDLIPVTSYPERQAAPIADKLVRGEIARAQRIIEGQNFDIRKTLDKYNLILERQRQIIFKWRAEILQGHVLPGIFNSKLKNRFTELYPIVGPNALAKAERQVSLHFISKCWVDYLDYMSYIRESIHLVNLAGKVPVEEFNKTAVIAFERLKAEILEEIERVLATSEILADGIDMEKAGLQAPSSTWTYLVNDRPEQVGLNPMCRNPLAALVSLPLWAGAAVYYRIKKMTVKNKN